MDVFKINDDDDDDVGSFLVLSVNRKLFIATTLSQSVNRRNLSDLLSW
jgi:hypothetical protein